MLRATKFRLYPTAEQRTAMAHQFGCTRWVWNWALENTASQYRATGKGINYHQMAVSLPVLKKENEWLKAADSQALQSTLRNLCLAFEKFFQKKSRYPRFKSKHGRQSYAYPQRVKIRDVGKNGWGKVYLPKVGLVRCRVHRDTPGKIKTVTVSLSCAGQYHASVLAEDGADQPDISMDGKAVGIDLGLESFIATSDGFKVSPPKFLKRAEKNLRRKQQMLSRKKKGSNNRQRAKKLVARCHDKIAKRRTDWLHKLSRKIVDENQVICVENLHVKGMMKNHCLAKSISDVGWSTFTSFLSYKARWDGKAYLEADRWFPSSKTCSCCGHVVQSLPLNVRKWSCPSCKAEHDRDVNAGTNIKLECLRAAGHPAPACGG